MAGKLSVKAKGKELSVGRQAYTSAQLRRPRMCGVAAGSHTEVSISETSAETRRCGGGSLESPEERSLKGGQHFIASRHGGDDNFLLIGFFFSPHQQVRKIKDLDGFF